MFERLSLRDKLFMSAAVLAVALVVEAGVGLEVAKNMANNLQKVYASSSPLNNLKEVSDAYSVGIVGAVEKTRAGQSWEMGRDQLEASIQKAQSNWGSYLGLKDINADEKLPVQIVNATLNDNKLFLMSLREAFEKHDARELESLEGSNLFPVVDPIVEQMDKLVNLKWKRSEILVGEGLKEYRTIYLLMLVLAVVSLILGFGLSLLLSLGISRRFQNLATQMVGSAERVGEVSGKIALAGARQAKGATEATESLLQTSVALSKLSSRTVQNAEGATHANQLMAHTLDHMAHSNLSMQDTLAAMRSVNESADKVYKIVKSIEEIAQQTNILSLNASVEAARAGEHGKGFAVVAEEVRSLAQRSAQAAKETSQLIEENAKQASRGMTVAESAGTSLREMMENTQKVAAFLMEIQASSQEQSRSIREIGDMMDKLETVTQDNNSNSKQTAVAAGEMAQQASGLKQVVTQLVGIVEGAAATEPRIGEWMPSLSPGEPAPQPLPPALSPDLLGRRVHLDPVREPTRPNPLSERKSVPVH